MATSPTTSSTLLLLLPVALVLLGTFECCSCVTPANATGCIKREREALLEFKGGLIDRSNLLSSWTGDDCCSWKGIGCSKRTGHVIKLDIRSPCVTSVPLSYDYPMAREPQPGFHSSSERGNCSLTGELYPSLGELRHLRYLDLSWNDFSYSRIPTFVVGSLSNLVYLNLSNAAFDGEIPRQIGNLSNLQYLDLGYNVGLTIDNLEWVSGIHSLKHLDLSGVSVGNVKDLLESLSRLSSLQHLKLANCNLPPVVLRTTFPVNFTSLEFLDLSINDLGPGVGPFLSEIFNKNKHLSFLDLSSNSISVGAVLTNLTSLCHLSSLGLEGNNFTGNISSILGDLISECSGDKLRYLDLSDNNFEGPLGDEIGRMKNLEHINLFRNSIRGSVPESLGQLHSLKVLALSANQFTGDIPESLGQLHSLNYFELSHNKLTGSIPLSLGQLHSLKYLDLSYNELTGVIPASLGQLHSLNYLDLSYNKLTRLNGGELHLANLTSLKFLDLSYNNELVVDISPAWVAPFQLRTLRMASCKVGPQFPAWLQSQTSLSELQLFNASITGFIPDWFPNISSNMRYLDLSSNGLAGHILGNFGSNLETLFLSNNTFNGSIPVSLCEANELSTVDLSNNQLSGSLPDCFPNISYLDEMNLGNNRLNGQVLTTICLLQEVYVLVLNNNEFDGDIPECLSTLRLGVLDLSKNNFAGGIPSWIGLMTSLYVLNLEFNSFKGEIPTSLCQLPELRVLNLAHSSLSGSIPLCIGNLTTMADPIFALRLESGSADVEDSYFSPRLLNSPYLGVEVQMKSITQLYTSSLQYLFSMDLSNNNLAGEIPQVLTHLHNLLNLNLSRNFLHGTIPPSIGEGLKNLESLDLSMNRLSGPVPPSLANLDSLGALNLSFNRLSGPIPRAAHLDTFTNESYLGNDALCGLPLSRTCPGDKEDSSDIPKHSSDDDSDGEGESSYVLWLYAGIAPGFTVGLIGACSSLCFHHSWRRSFFLWSDNVLNRLLLMVVMFPKASCIRKNPFKQIGRPRVPMTRWPARGTIS